MATEPHADPAASSPAVCVVDPDAAVVDRLNALCGAMGVPVRGYDGGGALLADIGTESPACIICEMNLPDMSAVELLGELRRRAIGSPFIVLSGDGDVSAAVAAMHAGALDFIEKPQADRLLAWHVHRILGHPAGSDA